MSAAAVAPIDGEHEFRAEGETGEEPGSWSRVGVAPCTPAQTVSGMGLHENVGNDVQKQRKMDEKNAEDFRRVVKKIEDCATKEAVKHLSHIGVKCAERDVTGVELPGLHSVGARTDKQPCVVSVSHPDLVQGAYLAVALTCSSGVVGCKAIVQSVHVVPPAGVRHVRPVRRLADLAAYLK